MAIPPPSQATCRRAVARPATGEVVERLGALWPAGLTNGCSVIEAIAISLCALPSLSPLLRRNPNYADAVVAPSGSAQDPIRSSPSVVLGFRNKRDAIGGTSVATQITQ